MNPKVCLMGLWLFMLVPFTTFCQKGKDGAKSYATAGTYILNRYSSLASSVAAGATSITVSNIADLSGATSFANSVDPYAADNLSGGDLVLLVQVQGATIGTSNTNTYGTIAAYNNTGNFELKYILSVSGNVISFCTGLANAYNAYSAGATTRTEVVRVPRLLSLTVGAGVTIGGLAWSGASGYGGVVAIESTNDITVNGVISASYIGFSGGSDPDGANSSASGAGVTTVYRTTVTNNAAGKGESIAGTISDYAVLLGANGRGAPANGGGGGNGHNTGGGGGANGATAGALVPYDGTGLKNISTASWANAWNLEAAGFATSTSTGGGRGGYSFSSSDQDALTLGPGNAAWSGDYRDNVGGMGGHPLNYNGDTRLFMGGGGGGGEGNNNAQGNGGNGGGIVYILTNGNVSGSGTIIADGQDGYSTTGGNNDGAGGGGGGGAVQVLANGTINGVSIHVNGGNGGNMGFSNVEADGPGGGGGGGYIATTVTGVSLVVNGGTNGSNASTQVTEFLPDGATMGNAGTIAGKTFADVENCSLLLPVNFVSFNATADATGTRLTWKVQNQRDCQAYIVERSIDGTTFTNIGRVIAGSAPDYYFTDVHLPAGIVALFYRIKEVDANGNFLYSSVVEVTVNDKTTSLLEIFPNPAHTSIQCHYSCPAAGEVRVTIYSSEGKLAKRLVMAAYKGENSFVINDVAGLQSGVYLVRVEHNGLILQQPFIFQR